jgi:hypothetical protein
LTLIKQLFLFGLLAVFNTACADAEPDPQKTTGTANAVASGGFKDEIIRRVEAFDAENYAVLGLYPGMRRDDAFAAVAALDIPFSNDLDNKGSIYAVKRMRNKTLLIEVDFAEPIDGWDNLAARAHTISINEPLPGDERVVAEVTNAQLVERFGAPLNSARNGMYFGVIPETSTRELAAQCQITHGTKLPQESYRALINSLSDETGLAINTYCPSLREEFIETNVQALLPQMTIQFKLGRRDISYKLLHPLVRRNSAQGETHCFKHGVC